MSAFGKRSKPNHMRRSGASAIKGIVSPTAPPDPEAPGPFSFGDRGRVARILTAAGFTDIAIAPFDASIPFGEGGTRDAAIDDAVKAKMVPPSEDETRAYFAKIQAYIDSKSTGAPAGMDEEDGMALREVAGQIKALSSERVRVQRVLIRLSPGASENEKKRAQKTAEAVKKRLDAGEEFALVAKEDSEDPESAARGGDLGYVLRGVAPPELEKAAFALGVGDTSGPIYTESGYNIIRVTEKRAAEKPEYEKFKDELANFLGGASFQKKVEDFVKGLRDKATIERNLPATL